MEQKSTMYTGSICLTEILEQAKKQHSAFTKGNGKIYFNFVLWNNIEPDKYGNTFSLQLNSEKDKREQEGKVYFGNAKPVERKLPTPITASDVSDVPKAEDLPF